MRARLHPLKARAIAFPCGHASSGAAARSCSVAYVASSRAAARVDRCEPEPEPPRAEAEVEALGCGVGWRIWRTRVGGTTMCRYGL